MPQLPRGALFIDLLVPPGTSERIEDLQTRVDLVAGGEWRVLVDDGTMERSPQPMQPLRGGDERLWVVRTSPFTPMDSLQAPVSLAVELAGLSSARLAAVGIAGLYSWGFVLVDDVHTLFGLLLLDWLYNPRLSSSGEVLETQDRAVLEAELAAKAPIFERLWTHQTSQLLAAQLPPGALQPVESFQALSLLGPGGRFDPRLWQGLAMQLVLPVVQTLSGAEVGTAPASATAAATATAAPPASSALPASAPAQAAGSEPADDGLTPLARAQRAAQLREQGGAQESEPAPLEEDRPTGVVRWSKGPGGPVLFVSKERFDPGLLRACQGGDFSELHRSERPDAETHERWLSQGGPFVAELSSFSSLFVEGVPLHRSAFEERAEQRDGVAVLTCLLQRVGRVQALLLVDRAGARRLLACSDESLAPARVVELAGS